ncbi:hypothetical protein NDU88_003638 [Pleurodeles waltl]|uniref:Uncharacterized protein n=1 Tax=Pleurodeles waltl TaxID=8319 RepID=A0AAV7T6D1_PLEWA|nr:hypothetical protein NDU88_003638 [Pleurodeles waltl]
MLARPRVALLRGGQGTTPSQSRLPQFSRGLLLPTLAPIQRAWVPTQVQTNSCVSLLAAPAAPLTPAPHSTRASTGHCSRSAARLRHHYTFLSARLWALMPLDPAQTGNRECHTPPVFHCCSDEAFLCPARAPTRQTSHSPQPRPQPSSTLREGRKGGKGKPRCPPEPPPSHSATWGSHGRGHCPPHPSLRLCCSRSPPLPGGKPAQLTGCRHPGPANRAEGPEHTRGAGLSPSPSRSFTPRLRLKTPPASLAILLAAGEVSLSSPNATRGAPQTRATAWEVPPHHPDSAAPQREHRDPSGTSRRPRMPAPGHKARHTPGPPSTPSDQ